MRKIVALVCLAVVFAFAVACSGAAEPPAPAPSASAKPSPTLVPTVPPSPTPVTPTPTRIPSPTATPEPPASATPQLSALFEYSRAVRLLEMEEYDSAVLAFSLVIRLLPDFALGYHGRGVTYYMDGRVSKALQDYDRAIELDVDFADALVDRSLARLDLGDSEGARADLERAFAIYDSKRDPEEAEKAKSLLDVLGE